MDLVTVRQIYKDRETYLNREITVGGWVRSLRDSKAFGFIVLSDGTYFETLQVVYHDTMENFAEISKLSVGTALIIKGTLVATPQAKQPFEIQACLLYTSPFVHHHDVIRVHDGTDSLSNHNTRCICKMLPQFPAKRRIGFVIKGAR